MASKGLSLLELFEADSAEMSFWLAADFSCDEVDPVLFPQIFFDFEEFVLPVAQDGLEVEGVGDEALVHEGVDIRPGEGAPGFLRWEDDSGQDVHEVVGVAVLGEGPGDGDVLVELIHNWVRI